MFGLNLKENSEQEGKPYDIVIDNWYKSLPYAFKSTSKNSLGISGDTYFFLPLNPKAINITTHFATNVISTLYGTVEEHSEQRYFDIVISGTTGFAPKFMGRFPKNTVNIEEIASVGLDYGNPQLNVTSRPGRKKYDNFSITDIAGGFFPKTLGKIDNALQQARNIGKILTDDNGYEVGVTNWSSGYLAFHRFYKWLLNYKMMAYDPSESKVNSGFTVGTKESFIKDSNSSSDKPLLQFLNYKDNNMYDCAISRFILERSAESPMLYNYTIYMRAYNLKPLTNVATPELKERYKDLGLDSKLSFAAKMKLTINEGKGVLSTGKSAISTLGA